MSSSECYQQSILRKYKKYKSNISNTNAHIKKLESQLEEERQALIRPYVDSIVKWGNHTFRVTTRILHNKSEYIMVKVCKQKQKNAYEFYVDSNKRFTRFSINGGKNKLYYSTDCKDIKLSKDDNNVYVHPKYMYEKYLLEAMNIVCTPEFEGVKIDANYNSQSDEFEIKFVW